MSLKQNIDCKKCNMRNIPKTNGVYTIICYKKLVLYMYTK